MKNEEIKRESFVFYRSFQEAISEADEHDQLLIYRAISNYALNRIEPNLTGVSKLAWMLIKPQLDANWRKFDNGCKGKDFGIKGGAPKGNSNAKKTTPKQPQNNPTGVKKTTRNVNVNDNVNKIYGESCDSPIDDFEHIWELYEKKGNKKTSKSKWEHLPRLNREKAIQYIPAYVAATPDKQYRKNLETFINQEGWNDELPAVNNTIIKPENHSTYAKYTDEY